MKKNIHLTYGIRTVLVLISLVLAFFVFKIRLNGNLQMLMVIATIVTGVLSSCISFKKINNTASATEVFFNGFRTTAIIAVLMIAFGVLFLVLFPGFKQEQVENFRLSEIKAAGQDREKIKLADATVSDYKKKFLTMFIGINMMIIVISGIIGAVGGTLASRRK
jgi:hypothetical protein